MERDSVRCQLIALAKEAEGLAPLWSARLQALLPLLETDCQKSIAAFTDYETIRKANSKGKAQHRGSDDLPAAASLFEQKLFMAKTDLRRQAIYRLGSRLLPPAAHTVEVGSGLLDDNGESFLSSSLPSHTVADCLFLEVNPDLVARSRDKAPQATMIQGDLLTLSNQFASASLEQVIGHNTLDTVTNSDMPQVLRQIFESLAPGGTLIHFMSLEPFVPTFLHNNSREEMVLWPLDTQLQHGRRFCSISRRLLERLPKRWPKAVELIRHYLCQLKPVEQERFWNGLMAQNLQRPFENLGEELLEWGIECSSWKQHRLLMEEQLRHSGFLPVAWEWESQKLEIQLPLEDPLMISVGPWGEVGGRIESSENSCLEVSVSALVAKKPLGGFRKRQAAAQRHFPVVARRTRCASA